MRAHARARVRTRSPLALIAPVTLVATALLAAGCSSNSTAQAKPAITIPPCKAPGPAPATLPHVAGSLTEADSGVFCLGVHQTLDVFLTAPSNAAAGARWNQIRANNTSVVGYGNASALTSQSGVTPGAFVANHAGVATLSSSLPSGATWQVTLVVK